ncbi:hypothetical protein LUR56_31200 [Streptomyces sp. MT29]|nr:hypothetical protein [Streptomyces sp. MT29]
MTGKDAGAEPVRAPGEDDPSWGAVPGAGGDVRSWFEELAAEGAEEDRLPVFPGFDDARWIPAERLAYVDEPYTILRLIPNSLRMPQDMEQWISSFAPDMALGEKAAG